MSKYSKIFQHQRSGRFTRVVGLATVGLAGICLGLAAQAQQNLGYSDTPFLPGNKWRVHDGSRPQPKVINPGSASTQNQPGQPPSDAIVLFDGKDLSKWQHGNGSPASWIVKDGHFEVKPKSGEIRTRDEYSGDCQLHVEWQIPPSPKGTGQARHNSGIFLFGRYEIQVLDSYQNPTYPDGQAAAIYGQYPPLVNATRQPGEWQTYDIIFRAPRFDAQGQVTQPAHVTILHNGVVVHHHAKVLGAVAHRQLAKYAAHGPKGAISLQDHGDPVRFRNIWIRELKDYDEQ